MAVYDTTNAVDLGDATVASGQITVPGGGTVTSALVGLRITSSLTTLRPPNVANDGEWLHRPLRVVEMSVDVMDTYGLEAGGANQSVALTTEEDRALAPTTPALHTGSLQSPNEEGWDMDGRFTVSTNRAYPATVRALQATLDRGT